jgi:hypothetical protein
MASDRFLDQSDACSLTNSKYASPAPFNALAMDNGQNAESGAFLKKVTAEVLPPLLGAPTWGRAGVGALPRREAVGIRKQGLLF